ncbi:hypothetical protein ACHGLA_00515 [Streptomyces sp. YH02]|uniref:hypothetical protein n=1 Tax=Streptomyces sp. YH02 TaxID=3256999 RepID=UPI00375711E3
MPTNFLSDEQRRRFDRFTEDPDEGQLAGSFLLDQTARRRAMAARLRSKMLARFAASDSGWAGFFPQGTELDRLWWELRDAHSPAAEQPATLCSA